VFPHAEVAAESNQWAGHDETIITALADRNRFVRVRILLLLFLLVVAAGCGKKPRVLPPPGRIEVGSREEGLASWYGRGDGYHGKITASGERFDRNKLTAAHFSLPFGTWVRVINKKNGRQVKVRINDRIPIETLRKGRIIDLSYKAAQELKMVADGVVPVEVIVQGGN
jgi:rare lipoprotein A